MIYKNDIDKTINRLITFQSGDILAHLMDAKNLDSFTSSPRDYRNFFDSLEAGQFGRAVRLSNVRSGKMTRAFDIIDRFCEKNEYNVDKSVMFLEKVKRLM